MIWFMIDGGMYDVLSKVMWYVNRHAWSVVMTTTSVSSPGWPHELSRARTTICEENWGKAMNN